MAEHPLSAKLREYYAGMEVIDRLEYHDAAADELDRMHALLTAGPHDTAKELPGMLRELATDMREDLHSPLLGMAKLLEDAATEIDRTHTLLNTIDPAGCGTRITVTEEEERKEHLTSC